MSAYSIDLCVNWVRVAECVDGTFDGVIRDLAKGEWRLTGATAGLSFKAGYSLANIDTIRVVRDDKIVFPGYVVPAGGGVGGLEIVKGPGGEQFTLSGIDAWHVLASRVAYPNPATAPPWSTAWDVRTGAASTAAAGYILANAGASALASRQIPGLTVIDGAAGAAGSWSARLQPVDELVTRICQDGGITCRLSTAFNGALQVALGPARDRRATTVLSDQGDLNNIKTLITPAAASFIVAGGQGALTGRSFAVAGTATGAARREVFSNQSSLSTTTELQQSADTNLSLGASSLTVWAEITAAAAARVQYLVDYDVGDTIAAEIATVRYPVVVGSVSIHVGPDRAVIRPVFGKGSSDLVTGLIRDISDLQSRFDTQIA